MRPKTCSTLGGRVPCTYSKTWTLSLWDGCFSHINYLCEPAQFMDNINIGSRKAPNSMKSRMCASTKLYSSSKYNNRVKKQRIKLQYLSMGSFFGRGKVENRIDIPKLGLLLHA